MSRIIVPLSLFVLTFVICIGLVAVPSCSTLKADAPGDVVDCTGSNLSALAALLKGQSEDAILSAAESAGLQIGGCIIAELINQWEAGHKVGVTATVIAGDPHALMDRFRAKVAPGKTFKTAAGAR